MVHTPQKLTILLYVAAGCTLCKAGFTQQDLTKGLGCLWIVRGLFEDLDNEMQGTAANSSDTNIVMFLFMYSMYCLAVV